MKKTILYLAFALLILQVSFISINAQSSNTPLNSTSEWYMGARTITHDNYYPESINLSVTPVFVWNSTQGSDYDVWATPTIKNGIVYFGVGIGYFSALNITDGSEIWTAYEYYGYPEGTPVIADEKVCVLWGDGSPQRMSCYNYLDGTLYFNVNDSGGDWDGFNLIYDNILFYGMDNNEFKAINLSDGSIIWEISDGGGGGGKDYNTPVLDENTGYLYYTYYGGGFFAVDYLTGNPIWNATGLGNYYKGIALDDYAVYSDNKAFNKTTGDLLWTSDIYAGQGTIMVHDGIIYQSLGNNKTVSAVYNNGSVKWLYVNPSSIFTVPLLTENNLLIIGDIDGNIIFLDSETGTKVYNFTSENPRQIVGSPSISNGLMFIPYSDYSIGGIEVYQFSTYLGETSYYGETVLVTADYQTITSGLTGQVISDTTESIATTVNWFPIIIIITVMIALIILTIIIITSIKGSGMIATA